MRPVLILGGGPAGAAAAAILAGSGHPVTLIERSEGPTDKVCGDFLSTEAIVSLRLLGLELGRLAPEAIRRLRLTRGRRFAETELPFAACSLTRRALDEALLDLAAAKGARILRGHMVRSLRSGPGGWIVRADGLDELVAETVFLATGKHDLRDLPRTGRTDGAVGLKMYFRLSPEAARALRGTIELAFFPRGYAGLQPVEGDRAVLCLTMVRDRSGVGALQWPAVQAMLTRHCLLLADRLDGAAALLDKPLAIAGIPYGYLYQPPRDEAPGLFRLGDQACVIPSLTGDGVSIALHTARLACELVETGSTAYYRRLRRDVARQLRVAMALQRCCVRSWLQGPLVGLARLWSALPSFAGRLTRLRPG